jgi:hypothetical protein
MKYAKQITMLVIFGIIFVGSVSAQVPRSNFFPRMAIYGDFGLVYNQEKQAYCFNNKIVGLFITGQGQRHRVLHPAGEIHIKVNRDINGRITEIKELTTDEYTKIIEEMEAWQNTFRQRRRELRERQDHHMNNRQMPRMQRNRRE